MTLIIKSSSIVKRKENILVSNEIQLLLFEGVQTTYT